MRSRSFLLDVEALRRFDIFEVDTAEGRLQRRNDVDKFVRVQLIDFNIEHIDAGELFKQNAFAFHHRLTGQRADIAQPQYGRAVGDHRDEVAARGIFIGCQRVLLDFQTGRGNARRVGQGQIALGSQRFCRGDLDFPGTGNSWKSRALCFNCSSILSFLSRIDRRGEA